MAVDPRCSMQLDHVHLRFWTVEVLDGDAPTKVGRRPSGRGLIIERDLWPWLRRAWLPPASPRAGQLGGPIRGQTTYGRTDLASLGDRRSAGYSYRAVSRAIEGARGSARPTPLSTNQCVPSLGIVGGDVTHESRVRTSQSQLWASVNRRRRVPDDRRRAIRFQRGNVRPLHRLRPSV